MYRVKEIDSWKNKFSNKNFEDRTYKDGEEEPQVIQWAGALHQRNHFNKERDPMQNWAEVLFRH